MSNFSGGRLKLKGGLSAKGGRIKKTKRKKTTGKEIVETSEGYILPASEEKDKRTAAERRYEEKMSKRESENAKSQVLKSHREKVKEFNEYLAKLTEHHDIPKVGPG